MSQQEISVINLDQLVSMTSVEIAELTGKEHRNVLRDIRNMAEELNALKTEQCSKLSSHIGVTEDVYLNAQGNSSRCIVSTVSILSFWSLAIPFTSAPSVTTIFRR